jgi:hypothetical protein
MRSMHREARLAAQGGTIAFVFSLMGCVPQPRTFLVLDQRPFAAVDSTNTPFRIALLPLANYAPDRDAPQRLGLALANEFSRIPGLEVVDPGAVEDALAKEPWLLLDRLPPDLADRIGAELHADGLLQGALLQYGARDGNDGRTPQISLALRLVRTPGSRVVWSTVHGRDGADGEWLFGLGRVNAMEQLSAAVVHEALRPFAAAMEQAHQTRVASRERK